MAIRQSSTTRQSSSLQKVGAALRNPTIQKIIAWALPMLLGWILSKFDKPADQTGKKK